MTLGGSRIAIVRRVRSRSSRVIPSAVCLAALLLATAALAARAQEPAKPPGAEPTPAEPAAKPSEAEPSTASPTPADSSSAEPAAPAAAATRHGPTDRAELEAFIDGLMAVQLKDKHIAGATVAVVVDGKPLFAKGYGYADVAAKKPVSAEETMFRIGSVSKLFTWTAIMQLAEAGKLDLDADVNTYLKDFQLPETYPQPVTLKHLLSHTAGFEDHVLGLFAHEASDIEPLGVVLAREMPSRVRPPGELASYSNHGTALAGHIVAQVSGMPWEDYVEQHLLQPLAMTHTSLRQPPKDELPAGLSKGYKYVNGKYEEQGFEYVPIAPAGSFSSSAVDMTHFLIAHLDDGRYGDAQILKPETARQMRELLFTHDPTLPGMAYGFMRMSYNGQQIIEHGGDTFWFHTHFVMLPAEKVGYFISYNTESAGGVRSQFLEAFLDRYYPAAETPPARPATDLKDSLRAMPAATAASVIRTRRSPSSARCLAWPACRSTATSWCSAGAWARDATSKCSRCCFTKSMARAAWPFARTPTAESRTCSTAAAHRRRWSGCRSSRRRGSTWPCWWFASCCGPRRSSAGRSSPS